MLGKAFKSTPEQLVGHGRHQERAGILGHTDLVLALFLTVWVIWGGVLIVYVS